ncbi:MAG: DUF4398 domain-containing protein [Gammaproteobacteria bacterium]
MRNATRNRRRLHLGTAPLAGALLLVGACASAPLAPTASLDAARVAIANAERVDAGRYAGVELGEAREQLAAANTAAGKKDVKDTDMITAGRLAEQARVEAELASAKTEQAKATAINSQLSRDASALTEEMQRAGDQR